MLELLQTVLLVLNASLRVSLTRATIAAYCLGIAGSLVLLVLSHLEHWRSIRASTLLLLYLAYSMVADGMRARTLWGMPHTHAVAAVLTTCCVCKLLLLCIELQPKTVRLASHQPTPDEQANILSRVFLLWLLPLFKLGRKKLALRSETLPEIEHKLTIAGDFQNDPHTVKGQANDSSNGLTRPSIFLHLFAMRGWLLVKCIPPRICYTGFIFTQPFLVQRGTEFLVGPSDANTYKIGAGLIAAYLIVYVGIAVSVLSLGLHASKQSVLTSKASL